MTPEDCITKIDVLIAKIKEADAAYYPVHRRGEELRENGNVLLKVQREIEEAIEAVSQLPEPLRTEAWNFFPDVKTPVADEPQEKHLCGAYRAWADRRRFLSNQTVGG